ncbi:MAG: M48 family metalloprotease [Gemmatimonadetes bacterium]|nr:M48 family metalloprotease [Gemmatimonadota bacterium]
METGFQEPVLVYDRIDANRRKTILLLVSFALMSLPAALYLGHQMTGMIALGLMPFLMGWEAVMNDPYVTITASAILALPVVFAAAYLVYRYSSGLVSMISRARPLEPGEERSLSRIVENLCIGAGLPQPRLAIIGSTATNAFSTGLDPERASLVVTRGLLDALDHRELEGVVAQELSQIGNYDVRLSTVVAAFVLLMWLPLLSIRALLRIAGRLFQAIVGAPSRGCIIYASIVFIVFGFPFVIAGVLMVQIVLSLLVEDTALGILILVAMLLPIYALVGAPAVGTLFLRAVSREREFLADADAVLLTRYPAGLARALAKMGVAGNARMGVNPALAHLYIVNTRSRGDGFLDRILSSHPPIEERIDLLARMGGVTPAMLEKARQAGVEFRQTVEEDSDA